MIALAAAASATDAPLRDFRDSQARDALDQAVTAALERLERRSDADPRALAGLRALAALPREEPLGSALADEFVAAAPAPILLTGYHEPLLQARRRPDRRFRHPIHRLPSGDVRRRTRAEIDAGALAGKGLELFWTDDPVELFFLHVQGSGRLDLGRGEQVRIGFAGSNERPYRSIGTLLIERGVFSSPEAATAPAIKAYLRADPSEAPGILRTNPRYVFFRMLDGPASEGPPGSLGARLVPLRSVAVDPVATPLGSVGVLEATLPNGRPLETLVVATDTGAAIRGPGRLDLFLGWDPEAARLAGLLRAHGTVTWLRPR